MSRSKATIAMSASTAKAEESSAVINARRLTRIYKVGSVEVPGIVGVDLAIGRGELVVLSGDSGSGKSTLLSLLGGLDRLSDGMLTVAGTDLTQCSDEALTRFRRRSVGMVFQAFNLLPTLTVAENICLPGLLAGTPYRQVRKKATELVHWLGLEHRSTHQPRQLSGGEKQRTAIARALINDPDIVLADEPTGNLDSHNAEKVMALLKDLNRTFERTVIVATHSRLADPIATSHIKLKDGRVVS